MATDWAASALDWWEEAGVDTIVGEQPRDWLKPQSAAAPARAGAAQEALPADPEAFRTWLLASDAFPAGPRVGPSGDPAAGLMMLIDMPGQDDARAGTLLSGDLGAMFDRMLGTMKRDRASIYLASVLPVWSPTGRLPKDDVARLAEIARHHIGLAAPRALLLFGDECAKALLGLPMTAARGRPHSLETPAGPILTFVTMSLPFLLNQPERRRDAMADLKLLTEELEP